MQNHIFINTTDIQTVRKYLSAYEGEILCCVCYVKYFEIRKSTQSNNKISIVRIKYEQ